MHRVKIGNNLLTFLLFLYYVLTMLFPVDSTVDVQSSNRLFPQVTMAMIGIVCIANWLLHWVQLRRSALQRPFLYLALLGLFYVPWVIPTETLFSNFVNFLKFNMTILIMFTYYLYSLRFPAEARRNMFIVFAMQLIYVFYTLIHDRYFFIQNEKEAFDSNAGFLMVTCIPMALILPARRLRLYVYAAVLIGCLFSGQRSAALAAVVSFPFCWSYIRQSMKKTDWILLVLLIVTVIAPIVETSIENIKLRNQIDAEAGSVGSGRSEFWLIVWENFWAGDIIHILFGNGLSSVGKLLNKIYGMPIGSHNGWLDMLYSFGILGFILYLRVIVNFLFRNRRVSKSLSQYHNILLIIFILFTVKCSTSHGWWDISVIPIGLTLAIISSRYKLKQEEKRGASHMIVHSASSPTCLEAQKRKHLYEE